MNQTYLVRGSSLGEASCWTRCHFQKHKPHICSTPTLCSQVFQGPSEERCRDHTELESLQSSTASASLLQRPSWGPPLLLLIQNRKPLAFTHCPLKWCSLPSSLCRVSLCVHFTKVIYHLSWLFPSILNSCLSLMKFGIKSSQSKRVSYLTQISERILLRKAWSWWPKVDGYYMPLTKVLRIPLKITS